ncbi:MAG: HAMP domain-containing protein [Cyanobacteria bacterium SID2]|nr:HAMP domain-containing protein [Cyanobacteria bacterium SID2]MBP0002310.1 HAMP domain-containing protein [Cyanobacteria bacterium SBC]
MSLRQKTLLLVGVLLVSSIVALSASLATILLGSFARLERQHAERNVERARAALEAEIEALDRMAQDWATWDDTYGYIETRDEDYRRNNLIENTFVNLQLNLLLLLKADGDVVFEQGYDYWRERSAPVPENLLRKLFPQRILVDRLDPKTRVNGLLLLDEGILTISTQPILTSEGTGPRRGTLVMGRYWDTQRTSQLARRTQLDLSLYRLDTPVETIREGNDIPEDVLRVRSKLGPVKGSGNGDDPTPVFIEALNEDSIVGYTLLKDIFGTPIVLLRVELPRDIYQQGQIALRYLVVSLLLVGLLLSVAVLLLLETTVLRRLSHLSSDVQQIGNRSDLSLRVHESGNDELSRLGHTVNGMLERLEIGAKALAEEQERAENLLLNILPETIADRLKHDRSAIAENFDEVTILFADIVGFTQLSAQLTPIKLVELLNRMFSTFDRLAEQLNLEKIKTIGDAYMVASGLPLPRPDHAEAIAEMALEMQAAVRRFHDEGGHPFQIRVGMNSGVVVAGVIGQKKFIYDLWGDAVNIASRMESSGKPGQIQVTQATYEILKDKYILEARGAIQVKGKGEMQTYWLKGRKGDRSEIHFSN